MKTKYLFLFTIGPVKSFLRDSRKTQDIFAGSVLLGKLCNVAMTAAISEFEDEGIEIITPHITAKTEKISIPNRFLAELDFSDEKSFEEKAKRVEDAVQMEFQKIRGITKLPNGAQEQLESYLEIHWLFQKIETDYKSAFLDINKNLAAIKNYKPFFKGFAETGRKCAVDGRRNVKFYRENKVGEINKSLTILNKLFQPIDDVSVLGPSCKKILEIWQLEKGEGISAVTLRKRMHKNQAHAFPSTVHVALMHIFEKYKGNPEFQSFQNKVQGTNDKPKWLNHSDDQLFFKENINSVLKKESMEDLEAAITTAHNAWSGIEPKPTFTPYYALIRFDGDKIGDLFSGEKLVVGCDLKAFQQNLSAAILDFAETIQKEIVKPKGRVVYAGGEDFMAFVNLHKLDETVKLIRATFKEILGAPDLMNCLTIKTLPTLSMGSCIAHYKEPLQLVLDKAAAAEKRSKDSGRDMFGFHISKHSGSQITNTLPWIGKDKNQNEIDLWEVLLSILQAISKKETSNVFLRNIYEYMERFQFSDNIDRKMLESKMKGYVIRAGIEGKKNTEIIDYLIVLSKNSSIENFAETLLALDFLHRRKTILKIEAGKEPEALTT